MLLDFCSTGELRLPSQAVVGCGAADLALAMTLGSRDQSLIVLESGGDATDAEAESAAAVLNAGVVEGLLLDRPAVGPPGRPRPRLGGVARRRGA
jgi:hypothetical protein